MLPLLRVHANAYVLSFLLVYPTNGLSCFKTHPQNHLEDFFNFQVMLNSSEILIFWHVFRVPMRVSNFIFLEVFFIKVVNSRNVHLCIINIELLIWNNGLVGIVYKIEWICHFLFIVQLQTWYIWCLQFCVFIMNPKGPQCVLVLHSFFQI